LLHFTRFQTALVWANRRATPVPWNAQRTDCDYEEKTIKKDAANAGKNGSATASPFWARGRAFAPRSRQWHVKINQWEEYYNTLLELREM